MCKTIPDRRHEWRQRDGADGDKPHKVLAMSREAVHYGSSPLWSVCADLHACIYSIPALSLSDGLTGRSLLRRAGPGHLCACADCATTCEQKTCPIPHCANLVESAMAIKEGDTRLDP